MYKKCLLHRIEGFCIFFRITLLPIETGIIDKSVTSKLCVLESRVARKEENWKTVRKTKRRYNKQVLLASDRTELQVRCTLGLILEHGVAQAGMIGSQSTEAVLVPVGFMSFLKKKKGVGFDKKLESEEW